MAYPSPLLKGALFIVASELMFASMGAGVKSVATHLPNEVIVFMRNLAGLLFVLPMLLRYGPASVYTRVPGLHLLRAALGLGAMYCFFYALAHLPLAHGVLLKMTAPIFMPLLAWWWLGEGTSRLALLAVPVGFLGVLLVLRPDAGVRWLSLVGLLGGLLAAMAKVTVRRLGRTEPALRTVFYFALFATLVSALPLLWTWRAPHGEQWLWIAVIGLAGTLGQVLLTRGYALAPAARVGPFTYFSVVFAGGYGYLFWGETLDLSFLGGAGLIAAAGVLALRRGSAAARPVGSVR